MISTTLNKIKSTNFCSSGWKKLLKNLGKTQADDEVLPFAKILKSNGIDDALWCCWAEPEHDREWRLFSVWCARQVEPSLEDPSAIDMIERYVNKKDLSASKAVRLVASRTARLIALRAAGLSGSSAVNVAAPREAQTKKFLEIVS